MKMENLNLVELKNEELLSVEGGLGYNGGLTGEAYAIAGEYLAGFAVGFVKGLFSSI